MCFFFFKQKTAYEMRISDWSSDVCSSDLPHALVPIFPASVSATDLVGVDMRQLAFDRIGMPLSHLVQKRGCHRPETMGGHLVAGIAEPAQPRIDRILGRSEEHTSELQSLMRISYAVFCLKKKKKKTHTTTP